jgi:diguanylate cyclase (GGDEF)-like protein
MARVALDLRQLHVIQIHRMSHDTPRGRSLVAALHAVVDAVRYVLPRGGALPTDIWERRHRAVLVLLWVHAAAIAVYGLLGGFGPLHSAIDASPVGLAAFLASQSQFRRVVRASVASVGLMMSSAMLVHLSGGYIEFHFHFFVMVAFVALYQDWIPFLLAVGFVVAHHGVLGTIAPSAVYNHPAAIAHPWRWALIHGAFLLGASVAGLIAWKANEYQALHDPLTRLPNRALFVDRLDNALARAERYGRGVAVLFVDLDHFKAVNDGLGHAVGDEALVEAGRRVRECIRRTDTAARLGGDEFAVVLEDFGDEQQVVRMAERLVEILKEPFLLHGSEVTMGASVGVCLSGSSRWTGDEMMRAADAAMYQAKHAGKGRYAISALRDKLSLAGAEPAPAL